MLQIDGARQNEWAAVVNLGNFWNFSRYLTLGWDLYLLFCDLLLWENFEAFVVCFKIRFIIYGGDFLVTLRIFHRSQYLLLLVNTFQVLLVLEQALFFMRYGDLVDLFCTHQAKQVLCKVQTDPLSGSPCWQGLNLRCGRILDNLLDSSFFSLLVFAYTYSFLSLALILDVDLLQVWPPLWLL